MVLGKVLGGTAIAMLQGVVFLALGWLTVKEIHPTLLGAAAALVLMFVLSVALVALGFIIAWRMESTQGFHAVMSVFLLPMWLLSGAFFPGAGGWLGWVLAINPLTYGVAGLRQLLYLEGSVGSLPAGLPSPAVCWLVTVLFAAAT